jgi:hypothetical protein
MASVFSRVSWAVNDVEQSIEELNQKQNLNIQMNEVDCIDFLSEIEEELIEAMISKGWSVIDSKLEEKFGIRKAEAVDVKA